PPLTTRDPHGVPGGALHHSSGHTQDGGLAPLKITMAAIADYASVSIGDKLNVMGVFDTIFAEKFPATHPLLFLAVRIHYEYADADTAFDVAMHLEDED